MGGAKAKKQPEFKCVKCGKETEVANIEGPTWCPECCPDHDYEYNRDARARYCKNCGQEPPHDWHGYDWD